MALVVGVNTYGLEDAADAYFAERPHADGWQALQNKGPSLLMGFRHLNGLFEWKGRVASLSQKPSFPRIGVEDDEGRPLAEDAVPEEMFWAQCELSYQWALADQLMPAADYLTASDETGGAQLKRKRLGPLDEEYFENRNLLFSLAEGRMKSKVYPLVELYVGQYAYRRKDSSEIKLAV